MTPTHLKRSPATARRSIRASYPMWVTVFFLAAVFLMGGGSRADIQSLVILRPLAAIFIGLALWGITRKELAAVKLPLVFVLIVPFITGLQLLPLPPVIWTSLPGRDLYAQAASLAGIEQPWRPISLVPHATWNSLYAWLVPIAMTLWVARLDRKQRLALLPVTIGLALASGLLGLAQVTTTFDSPLYLYEITNNGSAVGLFANRNHQAALLACLLPMLAVYASFDRQPVEQGQLRLVVCASAALFVLPLLLVTGSRAGLVLGVIGLISAALLYRRPRLNVQSRRWLNLRSIIAAGAVIIVGGATVMLSRATAMERLLVQDPSEELRIQLLNPVWGMIQAYLPVGIGFGTFPDVYKVHEPFDLLSTSYVNHAHNDLLEFVLEGGLPGATVLFLGIIAWVVGVSRLLVHNGEAGRTVLAGRLGAVIILILSIASIVDYPLRVPALSAVFTIAMIWMVFGATSSNSDPGEIEYAEKGSALRTDDEV